MKKKIMIAVGGTGGHVFPAMAFAEQQQKSDADILFVGGGLSHNRYFNQNAFPYHSVACGAIFKKSPLAVLRGIWNIAKGIQQSFKIIRHFKPDIVVGFGSYHSFPPLIAARMTKTPYILHEANSIPGKVIRFFSKHAVVTGIHFPQAASLLKGKTAEVGMPLRSHFNHEKSSPDAAFEYFQLNPTKKTILVFGGSQGAHAINKLFSQALIKIAQNQLQILHFTGNQLTADELRDYYRSHQIEACVKEFESRMDLAWQVADIVISRSGAGTIAEQLEFEVPGILIPYPLAADNHQEYNADFLVNTVRGGIKLREKNLDASILADAIKQTLEQQKQLQQAISHYKQSVKTTTLQVLVEQFIQES